MPSSTAAVATPHPAPHMKQLCRHFGHKCPVTFDDVRGSITFEQGVCTLDASGAEVLLLRAEADDRERLEWVTGVIGSHLERFASKQAVSVSWGEPVD